jgi:hypothetical protein
MPNGRKVRNLIPKNLGFPPAGLSSVRSAGPNEDENQEFPPDPEAAKKLPSIRLPGEPRIGVRGRTRGPEHM